MPFDKPPFDIYRINPLGIAERKYSKKQRLIVDLSAPHNNDTHFSLNSLIDKADYSVSDSRIDDAILIIKRLGPGSLMNKTDIVDASKLLPIRVDLWRIHGVKWDEKYYFFILICFGSRNSPKLFTLLSKAIHFIATNNCHIRELLYMLDYFLSIDPPGDTGNDGFQTMCSLTHLFRVLNIPIHPDKTLGPHSVMVFLGITLDSNVGLSFFVCCLAHRGSTVGFLLLQCSSGVVRHPRDLQVSVATRSCRVLIFASS